MLAGGGGRHALLCGTFVYEGEIRLQLGIYMPSKGQCPLVSTPVQFGGLAVPILNLLPFKGVLYMFNATNEWINERKKVVSQFNHEAFLISTMTLKVDS